MKLLFSEIGKPVEGTIWAGKSRVLLGMLRFPLDIQVECWNVHCGWKIADGEREWEGKSVVEGMRAGHL